MRLSTRVPACLEPNALTQALERRRAQGLPIENLTLSNPTHADLELPEPTLAQERPLSGYDPDPQGSYPIRQAIAAHHRHRISPNHIVLTASTSESYAWLFKLLADPGDRILVPQPSYPLFEGLATLEGVEAHPVPAFWHDRWNVDVQGLAEACTERTRAVVVVNPNNPTGQFLTMDEWRLLTQFCSRRNLALIVDEVFSDYILEPSPETVRSVLDLAAPDCPLIVLSGLSKIAAQPQTKLGWMLLGGTAPEALDAFTYVADHYLSVSAGALAVAEGALAQAPEVQKRILHRLRTNLNRLDQLLTAHPAAARLPVEGGWSVLLRMPALGCDEALATSLVEEGLLVHPGRFFGLPPNRFLVLSLLPAPRTFEQAVMRLLKHLPG